MSVKVMGMVWDMRCPDEINGQAFRATHKLVLLAYADHADHEGRNIWPSISTVAKKTGLDERSVQRLTHNLEEMGLLVEDGDGPRGTRRWRIPVGGGDSLSGGQAVTPDRESAGGDSVSGSLGDSVSPEPIKPSEPEEKEIDREFPTSEAEITIIPECGRTVWEAWMRVLGQLEMEMPRASFEAWVMQTRPVNYSDGVMQVATANEYGREWLESRLTSTVERLLIGIANRNIRVEFTTRGEG